MLTRGRVSHTYAPVAATRTGTDGAAIVHADTRHGMTPLSRPLSGWASDGAPFYNSGYTHPAYPPLVTGGAPQLLLPPRSEQLDLSDMTTWDRPVYFTGVR